MNLENQDLLDSWDPRCDVIRGIIILMMMMMVSLLKSQLFWFLLPVRDPEDSRVNLEILVPKAVR